MYISKRNKINVKKTSTLSSWVHYSQYIRYRNNWSIYPVVNRKEDVVYGHDRILPSYAKEKIYSFFNSIEKTGGYYVKWNKIT